MTTSVLLFELSPILCLKLDLPQIGDSVITFRVLRSLFYNEPNECFKRFPLIVSAYLSSRTWVVTHQLFLAFRLGRSSRRVWEILILLIVRVFGPAPPTLGSIIRGGARLLIFGKLLTPPHHILDSPFINFQKILPLISKNVAWFLCL